MNNFQAAMLLVFLPIFLCALFFLLIYKAFPKDEEFDVDFYANKQLQDKYANQKRLK